MRPFILTIIDIRILTSLHAIFMNIKEKIIEIHLVKAFKPISIIIYF